MAYVNNIYDNNFYLYTPRGYDNKDSAGNVIYHTHAGWHLNASEIIGSNKWETGDYYRPVRIGFKIIGGSSKSFQFKFKASPWSSFPLNSAENLKNSTKLFGAFISEDKDILVPQGANTPRDQIIWGDDYLGTVDYIQENNYWYISGKIENIELFANKQYYLYIIPSQNYLKQGLCRFYNEPSAAGTFELGEEISYPVEYYSDYDQENVPSSQKKLHGITLNLAYQSPSSFTNDEYNTSDIVITYNANGGKFDNGDFEHLQYGQKVIENSTSYTFNGWKDSLTSSVYFPGESYTKNEPLYLEAEWSIKKSDDIITYEDNKLKRNYLPYKEPSTKQYKVILNYDDSTKEIIKYQNINYNLIGWTYSSLSSDNLISYGTPFEKETTVYAHYVSIAEEIPMFNLTEEIPEEREGYTFIGWSPYSMAFNGTYYYIPTAEEVTLYPVWKEKIIYSVEFNQDNQYFNELIDLSNWLKCEPNTILNLGDITNALDYKIPSCKVYIESKDNEYDFTDQETKTYSVSKYIDTYSNKVYGPYDSLLINGNYNFNLQMNTPTPSTTVQDLINACDDSNILGLSFDNKSEAVLDPKSPLTPNKIYYIIYKETEDQKPIYSSVPVFQIAKSQTESDGTQTNLFELCTLKVRMKKTNNPETDWI